MYYDFYCNEQMLLENYEKGQVNNRSLKRLIGRSGMPPDKCADMYLKLFDNKLNLYTDRYDLVKSFENCRSEKCELLEIDNIKVYRQDLDYIKKQIDVYGLTQREQLCLFGIVMMCRILNTDTIDLTTQFKIKQFCSCFESRIWEVIVDNGAWYETYHAPYGMSAVSDQYKILKRVDSDRSAGKIGCFYTYLNYELKDSTVAFEFAVTPSSNRLNLFAIYKSVGLMFLRFCERCGKPYYAKGKTSKYCDDCIKEVKREQTRERVRRYRQRHPTM